MKTNVVMVRNMGGFHVSQRTKDGMFNATKLLKQWNSEKKNPKRDLKDFWRSEKVKEFLVELEKDDEFLHGANLPYVKSKASRGDNAGTWMHPYLFIKFAMWINPKFELTVIKFVFDELIKNRHLAGDNYKVLSASGASLKGYNFSEVAKAIQWIVFGKTGKNLRQSANEQELKEISDIEEKMSFAIDMKYIKTYKELMDSLRELYRLKQQKTPF